MKTDAQRKRDERARYAVKGWVEKTVKIPNNIQSIAKLRVFEKKLQEAKN